MGSRSKLRTALTAGAICLGAAATPALAETYNTIPASPYARISFLPREFQPLPSGGAQPGSPAPPGTGTAPPGTGTAPGTGSTPGAGEQPNQSQAPSPQVGGLAGGSERVSIIGDQLPIRPFARLFAIPPIGFGPPPFGTPFGLGLKNTVLVPSIRMFKIAEDESPAPRDRAYLDFNYFNDVNAAANRAMGTDLHHVRVYRETFGLEKTFLDGAASIGVRLPLDTLNADSDFTPGLGGSSTAVGDLTLIGKYVVWEDRCTGDLLSAGLLVSVPTGPSAFAGFGPFTTVHDTRLVPFAGYIWNFESWFVHGFTSIDVPTDARDVTMFYQDIGIGYRLYSTQECDRLITSIVPTFEVHANIPLDHRGALTATDALGTPDTVDLTLGASFGIGKNATFALAVATPVTGPRPFDIEVLAQFNVRFGPGRSKSMLGN